MAAKPARWKRALPSLVTGTRVAIGPLLIVAARQTQSTPWLLGLVVLASASDLLDGLLARRLNAITTAGSRLDSFADAWYYLWLLLTLVLFRQPTIIAFAWPIGLVAALHLASWLFDLLYYRRFTAFHAYSAKLFGLALLLAAMSVLIRWQPAFFIWLMSGAAVVSMTDAVLIRLLLPEFRTDVAGFWRAKAISQEHR